MRVLFVNCCRIYPQQCLDVINLALHSLPQPLSQGKPLCPHQRTLYIPIFAPSTNPRQHVTLFHLQLDFPKFLYGDLTNDQGVEIINV